MYPPRQAWVRITSSPYSGDTYKLAETVTLNVFFNKAVRVIGTPSVELTIGTRKRQACYDSTIYSRVVFTYAVQAADADADGISIDANAIRLNGGAIKDVVATNTDAVLTHSAAAASTSQKVDGSLAPAVSRIRFHPSLLPSGGTYTKGDTMWLEVWFDQAVSVSGSPRLGLQIGSRTRQAGGELSATDAHLMLFSYRVRAGDVDTKGVSIGANALTLNGGSIVSAADGTVNAVLTHGAVAANAGRKVDGGPVTAPVVNRILFNAATAPASGTYTKGATIWVEVWFDQTVAVSGIPQLGLSIGSRTRQANGQLSSSNARLIFFSYRVQAGDVDTDGASIGANALTLNGGSIAAAADGTTNAALAHDAMAADATRKVGRPAPVDRQPFFTAAVAKQVYEVDVPVGVTLPAAAGGDGVLSYTLTPAPPAGLTYTRPADTTTGGSIAGTPTAAQAETTYTLTATDEDGDTAALAFPIKVSRLVVSVADASVVEGAAAEFAVTLSETVAAPVMLRWRTEDGTAAAGEDYQAVTGTLAIVPGRREGTVTVRTVDDRRVEAEETFTVWVTGTAHAEVSGATATGRIADDDAETARCRALGMVLAGVGRTLAADTVDVIGERFQRPAAKSRAAFGGQGLRLRREAGTERWRHAAGVTYGVARALGLDVGSPLGGSGFGMPGGATWGLLTRPAVGSPEPARPAMSSEPDERSAGPWSRLAGHEQGLHQVWFDRALAADRAARSEHGLRMPVGFRRVSAREMLAQSRFETPLGQGDAGGMTAWTLWGRGTANEFDGEPRNDFRMDGEIFSGYVGLDYREARGLLLGAAVGHSRGDVGYETRDVTTGEVDVELTSGLPYAHWSPRPGLGLWGLVGAG